MTVVRPDLIVVGGGIFGLSIAWEAHRRGLSVQLLEAERIGAGASGGIVGALTPHAPSRWRPMMAFQFEALVALSDHVARLEEVTGLSTGYARSGRVTPLVSEKARLAAERDSEAALDTWGNRAEHRVLDQPPDACAGWISDDAAPFGVALDTVSARIDPRAYIAALAAAMSGGVHQGVRVERIDPVGRTVHAKDRDISAAAIVL
ncbi:MAG: FAD-binding oxidoreductase, partial [Pseudomonadota bacterium]